MVIARRTLAVAAGASILAFATACTNPTAPNATPASGAREGVVWGQHVVSTPNPNGIVWGQHVVPTRGVKSNNEWE